MQSFASGVYRKPNLERAWCDAAYWLREALAEPMDSIAMAKLETALEVLLRSESSKGSTRRLLTILRYFFGLKPDDPILNGSAVTAGNSRPTSSATARASSMARGRLCMPGFQWTVEGWKASRSQ